MRVIPSTVTVSGPTYPPTPASCYSAAPTIRLEGYGTKRSLNNSGKSVLRTMFWFLLMFQSYGVAQGASMAIVFNWDMLSFVPMIGLSIGVMSLIGRFVGANDMRRANQVISSGLIVAVSYSGVLAILFLLFRVPLVEVFATPGDDFTEIRDLACQMMVALTSGARLIMRGESVWSVDEFLGRVSEYGLTVCDLPTAYWQQLLACAKCQGIQPGAVSTGKNNSFHNLIDPPSRAS